MYGPFTAEQQSKVDVAREAFLKAARAEQAASRVCHEARDQKWVNAWGDVRRQLKETKRRCTIAWYQAAMPGEVLVFVVGCDNDWGMVLATPGDSGSIARNAIRISMDEYNEFVAYDALRARWDSRLQDLLDQ